MLLRLLIFAGAIYILYKLLSGDSKKKSQNKTKQAEQKYKAGEMVKDPMCGAYVAKDGDIRVREGDSVQCFCSYECRDKYLKRLQAEQEPDDN